VNESLAIVAVLVVVAWWNYRRSPACLWCRSRHYGRCIYNPRAGRVFANVNDGHFDFNDPNK
jgi:hypothetical protein